MSNEYSEFPGVEVSSEIEPLEPETTFVHLDDFEETSFGSTYIYVYGDKRVDDLRRKLDELQAEFKCPTGVVFPEWLEDEMDDLNTDILMSIVWLKSFDEEGVTKEDLEFLKEYHD